MIYPVDNVIQSSNDQGQNNGTDSPPGDLPYKKNGGARPNFEKNT